MEKKIEKIFRATLSQVDKEIKKILNLDVSLDIKKPLNYQIEAGGKRLRPFLAILSFKALGGKNKRDILPAAAGLEILHNYTLIIDDIIDRSFLRRGKNTLWKEYGKSIAECLSIDYAAAVFQSAVLTKKPKEVSHLFARAMKKIAEGEILDILFEQRGREDESFIKKNRYREVRKMDYLNMVRKKTGYLFEVSCEMGGMLSGASKDKIKNLGQYGMNLGIAFQIQDDILDIFGKKTSFGKEIGRDIKDRKLGNIILNFAFAELPLKKVKRIKRILKKEKMLKEDVKEIINYVKETGALGKAISLENSYIEKAKKALKNLPSNNWTKSLLEIADYILKRRR